MLSRVSVRAQSSAASVAKPLTAAFDLRSSRLSTGLTLSTVDLKQPIAHISIAFRAGSRFQSADEAGFAHRIRNALGTDSSRAQGLTMLWQSGNIGAEVKASVDRENIILSMSFPRDHATLGASILSELAQPKLEPWDLEDAQASLASDVAHISPAQRVLQLLHEAAYRNGPLAQSPFTNAQNVGAADFRKLQAFANSRLTSSECAVVGVNVDHGELQQFFAERAYIREGKGSSQKSSEYHGHGDVRLDRCPKTATVAVGGEAPSLVDASQLVTAAVVASIAQKALPSADVFYQPYTDSGLLGFVQREAATAGAAGALKASISTFKSLDSKVTEDAVKKAKAAVKVAVLARSDNGDELSSSLAASLLAPTKELLSPADLAARIDAVSVSDAKEVARKAGARLSLGAHGNLRHVPYVDEC